LDLSFPSPCWLIINSHQTPMLTWPAAPALTLYIYSCVWSQICLCHLNLSL
jgi:hypothetical protein